MEPSKDERLFTTLESLRPAPTPEFREELDERAAAGFPRRSPTTDSPPARIGAWLRSRRPRQLALAGGGLALAAIAVATVVVASSNPGGADSGNMLSLDNRGTSNQNFDGSGPYVPSPLAGSASNGPERSVESSAAEGSVEAEAPALTDLEASSAAGGSSAASQKAPIGPYASGARHREVERGAEMVLGTEPGEVGEAAGKVLETVHQYDGIVLDSSVRGGSEGGAGARFELLIPSAKLSDALAAFSGIAEVRSRHEASNDITAPTNTIGAGLQDSHARIDALLNELADSETETEREAVEAQLRAERRHAAALKAQLSDLQRRANLSHVSLRIETDASNAPSGGGSWGIGDAFHDAGKILAVAAGVAVVGLAVLAPIALLALLFWLGSRVWVRQRRERALG